MGKTALQTQFKAKSLPLNKLLTNLQLQPLTRQGAPLYWRAPDSFSLIGLQVQCYFFTPSATWKPSQLFPFAAASTDWLQLLQPFAAVSWGPVQLALQRPQSRHFYWAYAVARTSKLVGWRSTQHSMDKARCLSWLRPAAQCAAKRSPTPQATRLLPLCCVLLHGKISVATLEHGGLFSLSCASKRLRVRRPDEEAMRSQAVWTQPKTRLLHSGHDSTTQMQVPWPTVCLRQGRRALHC